MIRIACILLAAGFGKRFGGNKLEYRVNGVSMAERAMRLHQALPYAARVLVVRPGDVFVAELGEDYGYSVVVNERASDGIGASAAKGMQTILSGEISFDGALYGVCDQPYLTAGTVGALMEAFYNQPNRIVAPVLGADRGNPVIFPAATFQELLLLEGDKGGGVVIHRHPELLLPVAASTNPDEFMDIDTRR